MGTSLRELAEEVYANLPPRPGAAWHRSERLVLQHRDSPHPTRGNVFRARLADDVEAGIAEARAWFAEQGRETFTWHLSSFTTPSGLKERLHADGAAPVEGFESSTAMALTKPPPAVDGVEVRELTTLDELEACEDLAASAFGFDEEHAEAAKRSLREHWGDEYRKAGSVVGAFVDGELVAFGNTALLDEAVYLDGAVTAPEARGHGLYRALVHARWELAVARGTPTLLVQAGPMSEPILSRLGFRPVGAVEYLRDTAAA